MKRLKRVRPKYYKKTYMYMRDKYDSQKGSSQMQLKTRKRSWVELVV